MLERCPRSRPGLARGVSCPLILTSRSIEPRPTAMVRGPAGCDALAGPVAPAPPLPASGEGEYRGAAPISAHRRSSPGRERSCCCRSCAPSGRVPKPITPVLLLRPLPSPPRAIPAPRQRYRRDLRLRLRLRPLARAFPERFSALNPSSFLQPPWGGTQDFKPRTRVRFPVIATRVRSLLIQTIYRRPFKPH